MQITRTKQMTSAINLHNAIKNTKLRLKKEYSWDDDFVNMAVNEYGRFLELHKKFPKEKIVPGKVVDFVFKLMRSKAFCFQTNAIQSILFSN
jgi:hypothetical protein